MAVVCADYFVQQEQDWDCGVAAVINSNIWALKMPLFNYDRAYHDVLKRLKTDKDGTYDENMLSVLKYFGRMHDFTVKFDSELRWRILMSYLKEGKFVILAHIDGYNEWHYSCWYMDKNKLYGINTEAADGDIVILDKGRQKLKYFWKVTEKMANQPPVAFIISRLTDI